MSTLPTLVQPGDVISSDLMNAILRELARLGGSVGPTGTQVVPNLFGTFLSDARATILQPARLLALGFVFDVNGAAVDPLAAANFNLVVLNQSPQADARVAPNTPVNLVVSRASTGSITPSVPPPPTITGTETPVGVATASFAVNATMVIVGTNFSATGSQNTVTLDGTAAASVTNDSADPTRRLFVVVPTGIPGGGPVNPGDPSKAGVVVKVVTPNGTPATTTITVTAPVANQPTITSVSPLTQDETANITITGTNFTAAATVKIGGQTAAIVGTPTATQIVATVPDFGDVPSNALVGKTVVVTVGGVDVQFGGNFRVRGL